MVTRMDFRDKPDLAARKVGSAVLYATDDFFAEKDNLLKPEKAIFLEKEYTDRGKWMDGWESRRKRTAGHDYALIRLGLPGILEGIVVDTAFFRGNFPSACSLEGVSLPGQPTVEQLNDPSLVWTPLLERMDLKGDSENLFAIASNVRVTHLRFHIYPDGGVARLRVHGTVVPDPRWLGLPELTQEVDLAALEHGAEVTAASDMFFGSRHNLITSGRGTHMGDGWETKRSRREGYDWVVVQLAARGVLTRVLLDTLHFKGNFPESAALEGVDANGRDTQTIPESEWTPLLLRSTLQAHTLHAYEEELLAHETLSHVRMRIWPDGGVSRLRLFGLVAADAKVTQMLRFINALPEVDRARLFHRCATSHTYARALAAKAPFADLEALSRASIACFSILEEADWNDMFLGHPRIGEKKPDRLAMLEQKGMDTATAELRAELRAVNEAYEQKFGRIYLVCATGKHAEELLQIAKTRLANDPREELENAKTEQRAIADIRLRKLLRST
jgi:allantoicase